MRDIRLPRLTGGCTISVTVLRYKAKNLLRRLGIRSDNVIRWVAFLLWSADTARTTWGLVQEY